MSDSQGLDAGTASASAAQWTRIGGILVEREDLIKAIGALSALPDSDTIIIRSLMDLSSPLANTKYRLLADQYLRDHPEDSQQETTGLKHPPVRRVAFIHMLERHLQKLDELSSAADISGHSPAPDALDDTDARKRIMRDVVARQGQAQFRDALIRAYEGRCAITGCDSPYALEAAHIRPYLGEHTNVVTNGLLLRADIHGLFDLGLLAVHPATRTVVISDRLSGDHYKSLQGRPLNLPTNPVLHPSAALLTQRWTWFADKQTGS